MLDLSKVEAGKMELHPELFCARRDREHRVHLAAGPSRAKRSCASIPLGAAGSAPCGWTRSKFKQILFNLLSNAVKFTDPGGEVRTYRVRKPPAGLAAAGLLVDDNGIGIAPRTSTACSMRSARWTGVRVGATRGPGLGLSLTRELVELQGGRVAW